MSASSHAFEATRGQSEAFLLRVHQCRNVYCVRMHAWVRCGRPSRCCRFLPREDAAEISSAAPRHGTVDWPAELLITFDWSAEQLPLFADDKNAEQLLAKPRPPKKPARTFKKPKDFEPTPGDRSQQRAYFLFEIDDNN